MIVIKNFLFLTTADAASRFPESNSKSLSARCYHIDCFALFFSGDKAEQEERGMGLISEMQLIHGYSRICEQVFCGTCRDSI